MTRRALIVTCAAAAFSLSFPAARNEASGQSRFLKSYTITAPAGDIAGTIPSNSVSHISVRGSTLWIGTGKGLARSTDGGRTWIHYASDPAFANSGIFAVAVRNDSVWVSTGYTKEVEGQSVQTGSGYSYSLDNGATWAARAQTLDDRADSIVTYGVNTVKFLPIVVPEQNVTFDIALSDGVIWISSWSSGVRKSTDRGATWQRIVLPSKLMSSIAPTDPLTNYKIDPRQDNNYLAFSVYAQSNDTIWVGTAGGINKSIDGGKSWAKFTRDTQVEGILGDWVIGIDGQHFPWGTRIWTTNWPAEGNNQEYGVSSSDDGGRTWKNHLTGSKAYGFAFKDSIAYAATESGLFRTSDGGDHWSGTGTIIDQHTRERITQNVFYAVGVMNDTVYCGSSEGLLKTEDSPAHPFGEQWEILRSYRSLPSASSTYAYPNPFSPKSESIRIHYAVPAAGAAVTLEVFDFGMNRIRTIVKDAQRAGGREQDDIWDGTDDRGQRLPNGVYFYRLTLSGQDPLWGKIMVLQ
jgi:photosystem II stability/assembly factor-like uncharacterized protein